jgi:hypothetical protein
VELRSVVFTGGAGRSIDVAAGVIVTSNDGRPADVVTGVIAMPVSRRFADVGVGVEAEDSVRVAEVEVANVAVADVDDGLTTTRKAHHVAKSVDVADESPMSSANFLSRRRVSADLRRRNTPHMGREGEPAEAWQGAKERKRRGG